MSLFGKVKIGLVKHLISKIKVDSEREFYNMNAVKSIHLLYYINEPDNMMARNLYKQLYSILDGLRKRGIRANLTYFASDDTITEAQKMNVTPLEASDFSKWTLKPTTDTYNSFMYGDTDVLLNLSTDICWQLEYLAQYSTSKFKIGIKREEQGAKYDFLFKPSEDTSFPLGVFEQIIKYLEVINK
ncbi:MAG: hypothetical protein MJ007_02730 [Paludibacteraceae bacterium]|nr:hypothetical protein [Paludibacteraceae bacterium]